METIRLSIKKHQGEKRLFADFAYNRELINIIKEVPGARWSQTERKWHFNLNPQVVELLKQKFQAKAALDASLLKTQWNQLLKDKYYSVNDGELIIALDIMNNKLVGKIISAKPKKVITLDNLFTDNDQLKTNTVLQMKNAGIDFKTI